MGSSIRQRIQEAADLPEEIVAVPEWNEKILVRGMDAETRGEFIGKQVDEDGEPILDWKTYFCEIVVATCFEVDNPAEKVFAPEDVAWLRTKSGKAIDRLSTVGQELSGLAGDAVEKAGKGSSKKAASTTSTS